MDLIKEAFLKIKEDISNINNEIFLLKQRLSKIEQNISISLEKDIHTANQPTNQQTQNELNKPLEVKNTTFSIGNEGVPTNKQTNKQTSKPTQILDKIEEIPASLDLKKANEILSSLDSIKKALRIQFKQLSAQEMAVFSCLFTLEETMAEVTYRTLANKLNLSESSIRDYTNKLLRKGIPIDKIKLNNKTVILKISPELKQIASLATIIQLRDL